MEADYKNNDEITLKEIILKLKDFIFEIIRNWLILIFFMALGISYYLYKHYNHIVTYQSEIRFVVEGQGGTGGGLSSILGSIGIRKGGGTSPSKIQEVAKSSKIMKLVLMDTLDFNQKIGDYLIQKYSGHPKFEEDFKEIQKYKFSGYNEPLKHEDAALIKKMKYLFWNRKNENHYCTISFDKDSGIFTLLTKTISDTLSQRINNRIYNNLKTFFEKEIFEKQLSAAEILKFKSDSLKSLIISKTYQVARLKDQNNALVSLEDQAKELIISSELEALTSAYVEVTRNYELTDFNLKDIQPLFIEIEPTYLPIKGKYSSFVFMLVYGTILGAIIGIAFIILRRLYLDIME